MNAVAFVSVRKFATIIGISDRQTWRMVRDGSIPSIKLGRRRLIPLADAVAAIHQLDRQDAPRQAAHGL